MWNRSFPTAVAFLAVLTHIPASTRAEAPAPQGQPAAAVPVMRQFTLYDRQGKMTGTLGKPGVYTQPVFSPEGKQIAVILAGDVWIFDIATGTGTQITKTLEPENSPVWSRDGRQIAYRSTRGNATAIYRNSTTGTISELRIAPVSATLTDWSRDGRFLIGHFGGAQEPTNGDLFLIPIAGDTKLVSLLASPADEVGARLSFDNGLIAYRSDAARESETSEIFVRPLNLGAAAAPSVGNAVKVSNNGGLLVRWGRDDKEIYYLARDGSIMAASITRKPLQASAPTKLFQVPSSFALRGLPGALADISSDGERFALLIPAR